MLPYPATLTGKRSHPSVTLDSWFNLWRQRALSRSRATNLTVVILGVFLLLSLASNFRQWATTNSYAHAHWGTGPMPSVQTSLEHGSLANVTHLVIVAGHAIWKGCHDAEETDEANWVLQEHQRGHRSVEAFYSHITQGAAIHRSDPSSLLIFSGGITRPDHPVQSEGQSYLNLALQRNLLTPPVRAFTEDYALDSFQNLLFSIARYHELALASGVSAQKAWPTKITVVGFEMKKRRFTDLHRQAIRWPQSRFQYVGVDVMDEIGRQNGWQGELQYGYTPFTKDLYGCHGELAAKKKLRNPFARFHPYHITNPELISLMEWCPLTHETPPSIVSQIYPGPLPWDEK
ncbi:hypothetical protein CPB86DRAFT_275188 [Serendipita vermifera]|nr:hypothetical protein CPB86DRAFT_275188 [Serendipita vermifera]